MNIVLIDSSMAGISGDKLLSAFADMVEDGARIQSAIMKALNSTIGVQSATLKFRKDESQGIKGTRIDVESKGAPKNLDELKKSIELGSEAARLGVWGRKTALETLDILVSAETAIHGSSNLHELGDADTIIDIIGTIRAIEELGVDDSEFYSTPVAVGCGSVESRHGVLPVPAPATLKILQRAGIPVISCTINAELTTPTGAALLVALSKGNHLPPPFKVEASGVGIGNRVFPFPNITQVIVGTTGGGEEKISVIETNVDDVNGEVLGWLVEKLQDHVEDISIIPMLTKKNRPGHIIRIVVRPNQKGEIIETLFKETGTLGAKVFECKRVRVDRSERPEKVRIRGNDYSVIVKKNSKTGRLKPSSDDCKKIASIEGLGLIEVVELVKEQVRHRIDSPNP